MSQGGVRSISIVVPVYNGAESLPELLRRLGETLDALAIPHEILLVNDGSRDGSWDCIQSLVRQSPGTIGINLMRNYGQHNALLCGIRRARYEVVVTVDDDLQHPPEEIPKLLQRLTTEVDVVYGTPQRQRHGVLRDLASHVTKLALQGAMGARTARDASAFRAFRTRLRDAFADYRGSFVSIDVLLTWGTVRFASVAVRHDARRAGVSQYTVRKLVGHALNMMTGFSVLPLQVATFIGFAFTLFGAGVLAYVIVRYVIQGGSVPGFSFLASIIAIFSGAQLFALGIIGEYLARMHFRMMDRPAYAVESETPGPSR
jgi:undecaprenyl-phosphate 4-deoxy-4-formamido-L-arabinose transferase